MELAAGSYAVEWHGVNSRVTVGADKVTIESPTSVPVFRLSRHHLLERAPIYSLATVVGDMAGIQAQLLSAAQISLWSRVRDLRIAQIEAALSERTLVKAACMRRTLFAEILREDLGDLAQAGLEQPLVRLLLMGLIACLFHLLRDNYKKAGH